MMLYCHFIVSMFFISWCYILIYINIKEFIKDANEHVLIKLIIHSPESYFHITTTMSYYCPFKPPQSFYMFCHHYNTSTDACYGVFREWSWRGSTSVVPPTCKRNWCSIRTYMGPLRRSRTFGIIEGKI